MINLREKLNEIDRKCIDEGKYFYDLRGLFEDVSNNLSYQDKEELKKVIQNTNDPDTIAAVLHSKMKDEKNESFDFEEDAWDYEKDEEEEKYCDCCGAKLRYTYDGDCFCPVCDTDMMDIEIYESLNESDGFDVYGFLKEFTNDFTDSEGTVETSFEDEKEEAKNILKKNYRYVEISDGRRNENDDISWVIAYSSPLSETMVESYGLRWNEFNRRDQLVTKQKDFKTKESREKYIKKLEQRDNFNSILAISDENLDGNLRESAEDENKNLKQRVLQTISYLIDNKKEFPKDKFLASSWQDLKDGIEYNIDPLIEVAEVLLDYLDENKEYDMYDVLYKAYKK